MKKTTFLSRQQTAAAQDTPRRNTAARIPGKPLLLAAAFALASSGEATAYDINDVPAGAYILDPSQNNKMTVWGLDDPWETAAGVRPPRLVDAAVGDIYTAYPETNLYVNNSRVATNNLFLAGWGPGYYYQSRQEVGAGQPARFYYARYGALRIVNKAIYAGNITLLEDTGISALTDMSADAAPGALGTITGRLLDDPISGPHNLSFGVFSTTDVAGQSHPGFFAGIADNVNIAAPPFSRIILLGDNSGFSGNIEVMWRTTLQIGDGGRGTAGNLGNTDTITLNTISDSHVSYEYPETRTVNVDSAGIYRHPLEINRFSNITIGSTIASGGSGTYIAKRGEGTLTLTARNTFSGGFDVFGGTLSIPLDGYAGDSAIAPPRADALGVQTDPILGTPIPGLSNFNNVYLFGETTLTFTTSRAHTEDRVDIPLTNTIGVVGAGEAKLVLTDNGNFYYNLHRLIGSEAGGRLVVSGASTLILGSNNPSVNPSNTDAGLVVMNGSKVLLNKASTTTIYAIGRAGLEIGRPQTGQNAGIGGGTASVTITGSGENQIHDQAPVTIRASAILDLKSRNEGIGYLDGVFSSLIQNTAREVNRAEDSDILDFTATPLPGGGFRLIARPKTGLLDGLIPDIVNGKTKYTLGDGRVLFLQNDPDVGGLIAESIAKTVTLTVKGTDASVRSLWLGTFDDTDAPLSIVKEGASTLVFGGDANYHGTTTVNGGILRIGNGGADGMLGSETRRPDPANPGQYLPLAPVQLGALGTLAFNFGIDKIISRDIQGEGSLLKDGGADTILTLSGDVSYTGRTTVNRGTVHFGGTTSPATSQITLSPSGGNISLLLSDSTLGTITLAAPGESYVGHRHELDDALKAADPSHPGITDITGNLIVSGNHTLWFGADKAAEQRNAFRVSNTLTLGTSTLRFTVDVGANYDAAATATLNIPADTVAQAITVTPEFLNGIQTGDFVVLSWNSAIIPEGRALAEFFKPLPTNPSDYGFLTPRGPTTIALVVDSIERNATIKIEGEGNHRLVWQSSDGKWDKANDTYKVWRDETLYGRNPSLEPGEYLSSFYDYDIVIFDAAGGNSLLATITEAVRPARIRITGGTEGSEQTITVGRVGLDPERPNVTLPALPGVAPDGKIVGTTGIAKEGLGTFSISGDHEFTGPITVSGGVLQAEGYRVDSDPTLPPRYQGAPIADYGLPSALGAGTTRESLVLANGATLSIAPAAGQIVSSDRSFTVAAPVTSGVNVNRFIVLEVFAWYDVANNDGYGAGVVTKGGGLLVLSGTEKINDLGTGDLTLSLQGAAGANIATAGNSVVADYNLSGGGVLGLTLADPEGGKLIVRKEGTAPQIGRYANTAGGVLTGVWYLQGKNSYTGGTISEGGLLGIGNGDYDPVGAGRDLTMGELAPLGVVPETYQPSNLQLDNADLANVVYDYTTQTFSAGKVVFHQNRGITIGANGAYLRVLKNDAAEDSELTKFTINSQIIGAGTLYKLDAGTLLLSPKLGANTFGGSLYVAGGIVQIDSPNSIPNGNSAGGAYIAGAGVIELIDTDSTAIPLNWLGSAGGTFRSAKTSGEVTLVINEANANSFSGDILNLNDSVLNIDKNSAGLWALNLREHPDLTDKTPYRGNVIVSGGRLFLYSATAFADPSAGMVPTTKNSDAEHSIRSITVQSGATLQIIYASLPYGTLLQNKNTYELSFDNSGIFRDDPVGSPDYPNPLESVQVDAQGNKYGYILYLSGGGSTVTWETTGLGGFPTVHTETAGALFAADVSANGEHVAPQDLGFEDVTPFPRINYINAALPRVDNIELISTEGDTTVTIGITDGLSLLRVSGTADLTLKRVDVTPEDLHPSGLYFLRNGGTGDGIRLTAGAVVRGEDGLPFYPSGRGILNIRGGAILFVNAGNEAIITGNLKDQDNNPVTNAAGEVIRNQISVDDHSNLFLLAPNNSGTTEIFSKRTLLNLGRNGILTLGDTTTQILGYLTGRGSYDPAQTSQITHHTIQNPGVTRPPSTATLIFDTPLTMPAGYENYNRYDGTIGTRYGYEYPTPMTAENPDPDPFRDGYDADIQIIKRGPGTFTLGHVNNYTGRTSIEQGTLEINATFGALGYIAPAILADDLQNAAKLLITNGATLRSIVDTLSVTSRLITIVNPDRNGQHIGAIIESSYYGSATNTYGLRFTNTGKVVFSNVGPDDDVTLTLGGNKAAALGSNRNLFAPSLSDPSEFGIGKTYLRKTGPGEWQIGDITTTNTYKGDTLIQEGTLTIGGASALSQYSQVVFGAPDPNGAVTGTYGILKMNGFDTFLSHFSVATGANTNIYNRINNGGATIFALQDPATLHVFTSYDVENVFAGSIGDPFSDIGGTNIFNLSKEGGGTLTITGRLRLSGDTRVLQGTLRLGGSATEIRSSYIVISSAADVSTSQEAQPVLDVSMLAAGFTLGSANTLVAGTPDYRDSATGLVISRDSVRDLTGYFHLAGGTIVIGGTWFRKDQYDEYGDPEKRITAIEDRSSSVLKIDGALYSDPGTTSTIEYTFSPFASSNADGKGVTQPSDLLDVSYLHLSPATSTLSPGYVKIKPHIDVEDPMGYRLEYGVRADPASPGTVDEPAIYELIKYVTFDSALDWSSCISFDWQDPRYDITFENDAAKRVIVMKVLPRSGTAPLYWVGDPETVWGDPMSHGNNFTQVGVGKTSFAAGDNAIFDDSVKDSRLRKINISAENVMIGSATFSNGQGYDYTLLATGGALADKPGTLPGILTKQGAGTLYIENENTYSGGTLLNGGRIVAYNNNSIGTGPLYFNGGTGTLLPVSGKNLVFSNAIVAQGTGTLESPAGATLAFTGTVSGDGTLLKTGPGKLRLTGGGAYVKDKTQFLSPDETGPFAFTGTLQVKAGELLIAQDAQLDPQGERTPENGYVLPFSKALVILDEGTWLHPDFEGDGTITVGALSGSGTVSSGNTPGLKTIIIGGRPNTDATRLPVFTGKITDRNAGTEGTVRLVKEGLGTFVVSVSENDYTGGTEVLGGTLQIGDGINTGKIGAGNVSVKAGATLSFNARDEDYVIANRITAEAGAVIEKQNDNKLLILDDNDGENGFKQGSILRILGGEVQIGNASDASHTIDSGNLGFATVENDGILTFDRGGDYTVANDISGSGILQKTDGGTLTYLGTNRSTGDTIIYHGTFALGDAAQGVNREYNASAVRLVNSTLSLNPGEDAVLRVGANVYGTGGIVLKEGPGTAIITGTLSLSGEIQVIQGVLQVGEGGDSGVIGSSTTVSVGAAGVLHIRRAGIVSFDGKINSTGSIRIDGSTDALGGVIFTEDNNIGGEVFVGVADPTAPKSAKLILGDGGHSGALNDGLTPVTVHLGAGSSLVINREGENVSTGSKVILDGDGDFVKTGPGTVLFDSTANHSGGTVVEQGRLILPTANIPRAIADPDRYNINNTAYLGAFGTGILELRNGAVPFALVDRILGVQDHLNPDNRPLGTLALSSEVGVSSVFNFLPAEGTGKLNKLEIYERTTLHLGTNPTAVLNAANTSALSGATLTGQGTLAGNLQVQNGASVAPATLDQNPFLADNTTPNPGYGKILTGKLTATGDLETTGEIKLTLVRATDGSVASDQVHFSGTATFYSGATLYVDISALGSDIPSLRAIGEIKLIVDDDPQSGVASISGRPVETNNGIDGIAFLYNTGSGISLLFSESLRDIPGLNNLDHSYDSLLNYLENIRLEAGKNPAAWDALNDILLSGNIEGALKELRDIPRAHASLTAMSVTAAHEAAYTLRSHLEALRYDAAINGRQVKLTPYFAVTGTNAKNKTGAGNPNFDIDNYGAFVGIDHALSSRFLVGANIGYNSGSASLHEGRGKNKAATGRFSAYASTLINDHFYVDAQLFYGHSSYDVRRRDKDGLNHTASPDGDEYGASLYLGSIVALTDHFNLTPFAGVQYVHSEVGGFVESGRSSSALAFDAYEQNSLRARIGTGINFLHQFNNTIYGRFGLELAYSAELQDSEVDIRSKFAVDAGRARFKTSAPSTPERAAQIGPSAEIYFGTNVSLNLSYTYESDFSTHDYHHINAAIRIRF
jgi:autotransporter-associated beta strand protein